MMIWTFFVFAIVMLMSKCSGLGLSYNYYDETAQTYCASRLSQPGFVFAIRRDCEGTAPTCNALCQQVKAAALKTIDNQRKNFGCFDAIHIRKEHIQLAIDTSGRQPDAGKISQMTYGYGKGGCSWTPNHCGPNFCCC
uniref:Secreted protein n=1 Tax=Clytia hemisphaerica TaxID=252671 RepID=A0A7M5XNS7_9CNID